MFICPNCQAALVSQPGEKGVSWICPACSGRAVGISVLRKSVGDEVVREAWQSALVTPQWSGRNCPMCRQEMLSVTVCADTQPIALDVCRRCEFIWFDPSEYEALPAPKAKAGLRPLGQIDLKTLPPEAREKIAMAEVKALAERGRVEDATPDEGWKSIPAMLGMPVELDTIEYRKFTWATWALALLITAASVPAFFDLTRIVDQFGLVPNQAWRLYGLTFFTSFFLHGGIIHLVGNLYFLIVFGRPVENLIGSFRWLLLVFVAAFAGDLLHVLFDPNGEVPCIGASGGISGLLVFYAFQFPHARLGMIWRYLFVYYRWIQLPAYVAFIFWILLQSWGAYQQLHGFSNVSALAHFGGVAVGIVAWAWWRKSDAKPSARDGLFKVIG